MDILIASILLCILGCNVYTIIENYKEKKSRQTEAFKTIKR